MLQRRQYNLGSSRTEINLRNCDILRRQHNIMIVVFGASSDIGRRVSQQLLADALPVRIVSRNPQTLDPRAQHVVGDLSGNYDLKTVLGDARVVVSCAHARHTRELLNALPPTPTRLVLTGSAWRYSKVPNPRADEVRNAEADFLSSGLDGVMLHPTMIYGGAQERNIQRLLALIRRWPVIPAPGGGRHRVQPIHVDDVAACLIAAVKTDWTGSHIIPVAGPRSITWRDMAQLCMKTIGIHRPIMSVPLGPVIGMGKLIQALGLRLPADVNMLYRFREDVNIPVEPMLEQLSVIPRNFESGLRQAVEGWVVE